MLSQEVLAFIKAFIITVFAGPPQGAEEVYIITQVEEDSDVCGDPQQCS